MSSHASVLTAATTLAEWAHSRRQRWTEEPLPRHQHVEVTGVPEVLEVPEVREVLGVQEVLAASEVAEPQWVPEVPWSPPVPEVSQVPEILPIAAAVAVADAGDVPDIAQHEPMMHTPDAGVRPRATWSDLVKRIPRVSWRPRVPRVPWSNINVSAFSVVRVCGASVLKAGALSMRGLESLRPLGEPAVRWLMRSAALVSTASVVMLIATQRGELISRWDQWDRTVLSSHWNRVTESVAAATKRPEPPPPPPLPRGTGRLTISVPDDQPMVVVDGKTRGKAPLDLILPAGTHRVQLRSAKGSIERTVRVDAGESSEMSESIFPGWVAVSAAVELTLHEDGRTLKRDERGWAILSPGPHEIQLDNDALGIHETRKVVVTPGDTTRVTLAPHTSTLSITTNEPAEIWVDGMSLGETPLVEAPMTLGMHDVRVRNAMHERWLRVRVTLQPVEMTVDMTAE
ncbi:MAG TPA: PEGA domain-containing protein [Vicinamibacterales bacterium]|nr:PEGA domain-containing protein [Vicinamibacterales bacterium]